MRHRELVAGLLGGVVLGVAVVWFTPAFERLLGWILWWLG